MIEHIRQKATVHIETESSLARDTNPKSGLTVKSSEKRNDSNSFSLLNSKSVCSEQEALRWLLCVQPQTNPPPFNKG